MAKVKTATNPKAVKQLRPPTTPEAMEEQMISLAYDLVRQRLLDGTATSQETVHFLRLGSSKARLENEKLTKECNVLEAKVETLQSQKRVEELYSKALSAMQIYKGETNE